MKRIQVTIMKKPNNRPDYPLEDVLFDAAEGWDFSPTESVHSEDRVVQVYYGENEFGIIAVLRDGAESRGQIYEVAVTDISTSEYNEIIAAIEELDDSPEFFAKLKAKYH